MDDLFTLKQVNVQHALDLVQIQLGSDKIRLYYQTVFKLCVQTMGCAKQAMGHEGLRPKFWAKINQYERFTPATRLHHEYRRSEGLSNVKNWDVNPEDSLVVWTFNERFYKMHYSDAVMMYAWMRRAAAEAKNWAGDRSRIFSTSARLTDSNETAKILYMQGQ
ncbi:hypothetical protein LCGC14_1549850 [marine sediment metagenome]|uniref:Uncharacterized protein n=1 Tax=marine sediment metagenome TaxID=412755 RepID=A0A0F9IQL6_9ZZZZ